MNRQPSVEVRCRLADNLRRYRYYRGYTQERLGKLCGLRGNYVSDVEQATVNITLANLEAEVLSVLKRIEARGKMETTHGLVQSVSCLGEERRRYLMREAMDDLRASTRRGQGCEDRGMRPRTAGINRADNLKAVELAPAMPGGRAWIPC